MRFNKSKTIIIFLVLIGTLTVYNTVAIPKGEWVCIAKTCDTWIQGDEWALKNCKWDDSEADYLCLIEEEDRSYSFLLSQIDQENFRECGHYTCAVDIYVKQQGG